MKVLLSTVALLFSAQAFSQGFCDLYNKSVTFAVETVVEQLECASPELVEADIRAYYAKGGLCKAAEPTEPGTDFNPCETVANMMISALQSNIPEAWNCSVKTLGEQAQARINQVCKVQPEEE